MTVHTILYYIILYYISWSLHKLVVTVTCLRQSPALERGGPGSVPDQNVRFMLMAESLDRVSSTYPPPPIRRYQSTKAPYSFVYHRRYTPQHKQFRTSLNNTPTLIQTNVYQNIFSRIYDAYVVLCSVACILCYQKLAVVQRRTGVRRFSNYLQNCGLQKGCM